MVVGDCGMSGTAEVSSFGILWSLDLGWNCDGDAVIGPGAADGALP